MLSTFKCPVDRWLCREHYLSGDRRVSDFMNYTDDPCMNQFTWGQRIRMSESWFIRQALS